MHRLAIALVCALSSSVACLAESYESAFPYEVQTVAADISLRCGPGDSFYATEILDRGQTLTVYRQVAGGWLAVRPIKDSYSLLAARYARATSESDVVEVIDDHAVSWVGGADVATKDFRWQVRLKPGEKIVVLGEESRRTFPGGPLEVHYRIAPPAGEFRWIHERDVRHASQIETPEAVSPGGSIQLTDFRVVVKEPIAEPRRDGFVARKPKPATDAAKVTNTSPDNAKSAAGPDDATSAERSPRALSSVDKQDANRIDKQPRVARLAPRERTVASTLPPLTSAEFEKQIRKLDVDLSLTVAKPVEDWDLDRLVQEVDNLIARGGSTFDRGRAQLLSTKLDEFAQLKARFETADVTSETMAGEGDSGDAGAETSTTRASLPEPSGVDPRFDGAGWLYPVHSRNQASPPYALLNADGVILQFVSPAPGLNLHRYLRTEIGVFGQQTRGAGLDKPHVTAQRVVDLKRHRR